MKKKSILIMAALLCFTSFAQAQNDDDEIQVITDEGALDVMDVPVGMMLEVEGLR